MKLHRLEEQPVSVEIKLDDDWFIKTADVKHAGTVIPTHSHEVSHATVLASGSMRVWADDELLGDFVGPTAILIKAKVKHRMLTLTDNVVFACVHYLNGTGDLRVDEEHHVEFEEN